MEIGAPAISRVTVLETAILVMQLNEANFSAGQLTGSTLDGVRCNGTNFENAHLVNVSFRSGTAEKAKFTGTDFSGSDLRGLTGIEKMFKKGNFVNTIMPDGRLK